jgi:hypothetical protein
MVRSNFIPVTLAALCGLALQFQPSGANAQSATLWPGRSLTPGTALRSGNGHILAVQHDGNVVLYTASGVLIWSTNTRGYQPLYFLMKPDGNLVLVTTTGQAWASNTSSNPGASLVVQDDGNLAIYRGGSQTGTGNNPLWASDTSGR